jgi:hypothetical protein
MFGRGRAVLTSLNNLYLLRVQVRVRECLWLLFCYASHDTTGAFIYGCPLLVDSIVTPPPRPEGATRLYTFNQLHLWRYFPYVKSSWPCKLLSRFLLYVTLTPDRWCDRCDRPFATSGALEQHIRNSLHHHECPVCKFDAPSWDELVEHCREEGCRTVCQGCFDGAGGLWKRNCDAYWEHLEDENVCTECERHCSGTHNLHQVDHASCQYVTQ